MRHVAQGRATLGSHFYMGQRAIMYRDNAASCISMAVSGASNFSFSF